jgi:4-amino-4-deoxy-L-arabinose transferase-like glycosyltransferase
MRRLTRLVLRHPLLAVLLLALLMRLALWAQPLHEPANDEIEYIAVAADLLAGRGWSFYDSYHWLRAPLYPLFLAGSLWLSGGNLHLAALPNVLLSTATVGLVYVLTREAALWRAPGRDHRGVALLGGVLAAALLTLGTFASLYMSETLFAFLLTAAVLLLLRWKRQATPAAPRLWLPALAGLCYGLAILTRSLPLAFAPLLLLWLLPGGPGWRASVAAGGICALCAALCVAPWTLRNCQAYGECILVETGFSYNMWAFNEPRESMNTIFETLEQIPNPATRADVATQRGLERLQEDPAILLRKLAPNWVYIWRIKPIQDRFLMPTYYADPPPLLFLWALLADDALYVLIAAAGVLGLSWGVERGRWRAALGGPAVLVALWITYVVAASMLTHGEARYRHFFFTLLIPYAALGLRGLRDVARGTPEHTPRLRHAALWAGRGALLALLLATVATHYPWEWARKGALRSLHTIAGNLAATTGNADAAEVSYRRALDAQHSADVWIAIGDLRLAQGNLTGATYAYRRAWRQERHYIGASARYANLLRMQGRDDAARRAFEGFYVSEQAVLDWSWAHLAPPPTRRVDVGNGLDFGYVTGVYQAEQQAGTSVRWTNGHGRLRLAVQPPAGAPPGAPALLRLRVAAPHPDTARVPLTVCTTGRCQPVMLAPEWRTLTLLVPPAASDDGQVIELHSPTFAAADGRELGVLLDWAAVAQ